MNNKSKQTVLITGASSGIGFELAKIFAQNNFDLILVAMNPDKLDKAKQELAQRYQVAINAISLDLSVANAAVTLAAQIKELGKTVDILVNNAGYGDHAGFLDSSWPRQKNIVDLNIIALMQLTHIFGQEMRTRGFGRILNIASIAALQAGPYMSIYYASKAFVLSFSQAVAAELEGTGVTVTALCPGPTATNFEAASHMKNSRMFKIFKPTSAEKMAGAGYKAVMKGRRVKFYGASGALVNLMSRLLPRKTTAKMAKFVNGIPAN